jgi:HTH-type transcriptional regulator/antitoxin HigA
MEIKPLRNEVDYRAVRKEVSKLFENPPKRGTADGDRFEVLLTLLDAYESKHHAIDPPDPIEAIKFRMEQQSLTVQDMVPFIGATNRVYEVLNETRPLTLSMMKRIRIGLKISGDVLLGQKTAGKSAERTRLVRAVSPPKPMARPVAKLKKRRVGRGAHAT